MGAARPPLPAVLPVADAEPLEPVAPDVVPVPVDVLLLVVPEAVPPPDSVGTFPPREGTDPGDSVGMPPGSAGTAGTLGPLALAVPPEDAAGGVTTVVTPVGLVAGMTVAPRTLAGAVPVAVVAVAGGVLVAGAGSPPPVTTRGAPPSGSTQFTSRLEQ